MTFKLGLTGSIGMGKSTTAQMFRDLGVPVWDADATVARLYEKGGAAIPALKRLNPDFVTDGAADRAAMKTAISADPNMLAKIETIVHPLVRDSREQFTAENIDAPLVVFDIPLLFETKAEDQVDAILVVSAPAEIQRARVLERGSMSEDMFNTILAKQVPDAEKRRRADHVIETLELEATRAAVTSLVEKLRGQNA
ncbi:dephospho-CoA kinase [Litoreibacter ponti]|uniref:Dephospho-CoA kinase n=1 Tax=Litoreibacter ponti TaxID=1510457 RepID=A0A2T6BP76_9RHOB|nr:dephospho-CoA kinase [Litoreibacter ponti]PTX57879.1 dephospho-CoA kinase [Litoreibacter ponti]